MKSHSTGATVAALVAAALTLPTAVSAASAADPTKGGLYIGNLAGEPERRLNLSVSRNGKTATAALFCINERVGQMRPFPIVGGKFKAEQRRGDVLMWKIAGRFDSSTKATVSVKLVTLCLAKSGRVTLKLSSSR